MSDYLKEIFDDRDYELSDEQFEKLELYYELLVDWNQRMNLTAITDYKDVALKHFLDSALPLLMWDICTDYGYDDLPDDITEEELEQLPMEYDSLNELFFKDSVDIIDVGSGAGFPGMVLAILMANWKVTLLEPQQKRVDFLEYVVSKLSLDNVRVVRGRAEEFGHDPEFRNSFDLVLSRAVAEQRVLLELCMPFVKQGGYYISFKGPAYAEEDMDSEHAKAELNCRKAIELEYHFSDMNHFLVIYVPTGETPAKYPRRNGVPGKRPL